MEVLTKIGAQCDMVANGKLAVAAVWKRGYDLVLMDCQMPEMDGFTLTRNIKQDPRFAGLPVIIHSSLTGTTNESHVKSVGADAYVAKFVAEELGATSHSVLARQKS